MTGVHLQEKTADSGSSHSFRLHPEAVYAVVDDLELPSSGGVAKLLHDKKASRDITSYFANLASDQKDKENMLPTLPVEGCYGRQQRRPSKAKKAKQSEVAGAVKSDQQQQVVPPHQMRIDTLLNKRETNIHVTRSHTTCTPIIPDVLSSSSSTAVDDVDVVGPRHEQSCHAVSDTSDDLIDCLFDDIDYNDLFDMEPLPLVMAGRGDVTSHQQQDEGSGDHNERSCDLVTDNTIIEIPDDDDDTDVSSLSCASTISVDDVVMVKGNELSRRTIFRNTRTIKELSTKQIGRWMVFRKCFIRDIMAGKVPCERHNKYKEGNNARRIIRNESFLITAFSRDQLDYIIDHLRKMFELDGLLNYDYVMSVLLIEVCVHIIMDLHIVDYHRAEKTLMMT